jgi:biopolymer transport protein ExbD
MKTRTIILLTTFIFASSFATNAFADNKTEDRQVDKFDAIGISVDAKIELYQGNKTQVLLNGDEDVLKDIVTRVRNKKLIIKYDKPFSFNSTKEIKIKITTPEIKEIEISGSAELLAKTNIQNKKMDLEISGSGEIHINDLLTGEMDVDISGSGEVHLAGKKVVERLDLDISGSGEYNGENLKINYADIDISGSGSCIINAEKEIDADISGSGGIKYKGNALIDADVSGSGNVRNID